MISGLGPGMRTFSTRKMHESRPHAVRDYVAKVCGVGLKAADPAWFIRL